MVAIRGLQLPKEATTQGHSRDSYTGIHGGKNRIVTEQDTVKPTRTNTKRTLPYLQLIYPL
jgi:hypothetical protein